MSKITGRSSLRYKPKASPARANAAERRGLAYLASPEPEVSKRATHKCRVYYTSEGGELLCFDSGPLTPFMAQKMADSLPPQREWKGGYYGRGYSSDAIACHVLPLDYAGPTLAGARLVTLPSQMNQPVQMTQPTLDESLPTLVTCT